MKRHIRLTQHNTTQQYLRYVFRSKLEVIVRLIVMHTYAGAGTKLVASRRGLLSEIS